MKKYIYLFIFLIFILTNIFVCRGFLTDPVGLDLYKDIDSGIYDLEIQYIERDLKGDDMNAEIADDLNARARQNGIELDCFSQGITVEDMRDIYNGSDDSAEKLQKITQDCFDENNSISAELYGKLLSIVKGSYSENLVKTQNKIDQVYKIGKIGMYSDGIEENSPFDLMTDLEDINSIIFEEYIPYEGVNNYDISDNIEALLSGEDEEEAFNLSNSNFSWDSTDSGYTGETSLSGICEEDYNNSGLGEDFFNDIVSDVGDYAYTDIIEEGILEDEEDEEFLKESTGYESQNDNNMWPCSNFFCIVVDFATYSHDLLGGSANLSIEGLIKRSNEHLSKYASTSLIQSKMTTNTFELGLKDLNLPDIFHVGVQVSYKPVPIISVDKKEKDLLDNEFRYKNLFEKYYANFGLEYERANDMKKFLQKEAELKSILDGQELSPTVASEKLQKYHSIIEGIKEENNYITETVDKKILKESMDGFYSKYMELETFSRALMEYTFGIKGIITKMEEIKQGS